MFFKEVILLMENSYSLLTGAGFTNNFGAPLARDFKNLIYKDLKHDSQILTIINETSNFEDIYSIIMYSSILTDSQKKKTHEAFLSAFEQLNRTYISTELNSGNSKNNVKTHILEPLKRKNGTFYTLNQDKFIEEYLDEIEDKIFLPGINRDPSAPIPNIHGRLPPGKRDNEIGYLGNRSILSNDIEFLQKDIKRSKRLKYIKLHGSSNWHDNDKKTLVFGTAKEPQISQIALLKHYHTMFAVSVNNPNAKILIIGYSFSDDHINEKLSNGIKAGLKVYLMYPSNISNDVEKNAASKSIVVSGKFDLEKILKGDNFECIRLREEFYDIGPFPWERR